MEVMMGPTFTIDVQSSPPLPDHNSDDAHERTVPYGGSGFLVGGGKPEFFTGELSESSSSIGTPDDSDNEIDDVSEEEEEVQSKLKGLNSLESLEDSLSIKKGLSSHFIGKSKSFTDLSQVSDVKELEKQENPFNKRKRALIAAKWSRRSFYSWSNPKSMPILPMVDEDQDNYYDDEAEEDKGNVRASSSSESLEEKKSQEDQVHQLRQLDNNNRVPQSYAAHMRLRLGSFKSRSFSLADLQEHDNEEDEEEEDDDDDH
ncbi:hypothetical protein RIF29_27082 [Crotalaria pallida]|uniref:Uncharacterized protein n=1 Tax=Crotalaria pallida TaxID=3830 RepID=A0AAN9I0Q1_CROPI